MKSVVYLIFFITMLSFGQRSDFKHSDFKKADRIAELNSGASLKNLPVLAHNLTSNLAADVEKLRAIYTWVSTNIENDYSSYLKTRNTRKKLADDQKALAEWNNSYTPKVFKNLLKHKKTACTGYAYLIRELANLAGLECKIIDGYGRTSNVVLNEKSIPNHSWNAVKLDTKWYLCDATWSAGQIVIDNEGTRFKADYFDAYFLADPSLFIKNHFPVNTEWTLLSKPQNFKEFIQAPLVYKEAFRVGIYPSSPKQMHLEIVKNDTVSFVLNSSNAIKNESVFLVLNNGSTNKHVQPIITKNQDQYVLEYTFDKSGKYDVHLKIDDAIIATYVIRVKRR